MRCGVALGLALALTGVACSKGGPPEGPPLSPAVDLGPSLEATSADPLLLTVAATRYRSHYLADQGYTLTWDDQKVPSFHTQTAGDLGVVLQVDGKTFVSEDDFASPVTVDHTASDALVLHFDVDAELSAELWFYAGTSRAATLVVRLSSTSTHARAVTVLPYVRRCDETWSAVAPHANGLAFGHSITPDPLLPIVGPGTYVTDAVDALVGAETPGATFGAAVCGATASADLRALPELIGAAPSASSLVGLRFAYTLAAQSSTEVRVHRAVVDAAAGATLDAELQSEEALDPSAVLSDGKARLDAAPSLTGLTRPAALLYRSSFALLDQVTMPAEGKLAHPYYVFSREPTWWFGRLGINVHESLSMILLAHMNPTLAMETERNFIDRIEPDAYLPYSFGPVVEQTEGQTAAAPLFSFESNEIAKITKDPAFLAAAYAAGKQLHGFWVTQRDVDQNGLSEWGGVAVTESLRDEDNVIWTEVAPPHEVEAIDLNCMLVMEEKALAAMATSLGSSEAAGWQAAADTRAAKINALMWDDVTGFYYHVARATHTFSYAQPNDLKRMEIAGLLPLWAGIVPPARLPVLLAKLKDPTLFLRAQGVPGLNAKDPFYAPTSSGCCEWNGPVWVPWQWLIVRGLRGYGETALADDIMTRTQGAVLAELTRDHQFREHYDPDDATPPNESMPNYLWSAMTALMMLEQGTP